MRKRWDNIYPGPVISSPGARPNSFHRLAPLPPPCPLCLCGEIFLLRREFVCQVLFRGSQIELI
jgi:hypothetical protein